MMKEYKINIILIVLLISILFLKTAFISDAWHHFFNFSETNGLRNNEFGTLKSYKEILFNFLIIIFSLVSFTMYCFKIKYGWIFLNSCLCFGILILSLTLINQFLVHISKVDLKLIFVIILQIGMIYIINRFSIKKQKPLYRPILGGILLFGIWFALGV